MCRKQIANVLAGVVMAAVLVASPVANAAVDMFLKLSEIDGESQDDIHKNEVDVLAWSWGGNSTATWNSPGCANVQDFAVTKYVDKASPKLIERLATGQPILTAKLTVRKAGENPLEYIIIEMRNAIVSSISTGGSGGEDRLTENVTLNFASLKFTYTPWEKDKPGAPVVANIATSCKK